MGKTTFPLRGLNCQKEFKAFPKEITFLRYQPGPKEKPGRVFPKEEV